MDWKKIMRMFRQKQEKWKTYNTKSSDDDKLKPMQNAKNYMLERENNSQDEGKNEKKKVN
jgi:hypothetical protein